MTDATDMSDDHLYDHVIEWDRLRKLGQEVPPEELCRDEPELLKALKVRIESVKRTDWLYEPEPTTDDGNFLTLPDIKKIVVADETLPQSKLTTDEFTQAITTSGLMACEAVQSIQRSTSAEDARDLAVALVGLGKLTHYQASVLLECRKEPLVMDRYIILERLDAGGMGQVFKALHRPMERVVALKMPPPASVDSPDKVQRFQREVRAAAKLSHPNIVTAHDACEAGGVHFLVMELVDGQDLHKLVRAEGPLSVSKAVAYVVQAAKGLEYAHSQGVIHRDIKPQNLILDKNGTVKVLDLGLARFESHTVTQMTCQELTEEGIPMGTVAFMSPEQALDAKHADHRSDVYSLGCTMYFLLTGRPPYHEDTPMKTLVAHREQAVPTLRAARKKVPEGVDAVYCKMVAKRPEDRHQTMREVIDALEGCGVSDEDPATSTAADSRTSPLAEIVLLETRTYRPEEKCAWQTQPNPRRWRLGVGVALGLLFVGLVFAGIVFKIKTSGGTVVLECNQPELDGAVVTVDGEERITIKLDDKAEPITIKLEKGRRKLEVVKGGFKTFTDEFEIGGGEKKPIKVYLERLPTETPAAKAAHTAAPNYASQATYGPNAPPPAIAPFSADKAKEHQEAWAKHLSVPVQETNSIGMKLALIPPGEFEMGSTPEQIADELERAKKSGQDPQWYLDSVRSEGPRHHVRITRPFYLSVCQVTQEEYEKVIGSNPSVSKGNVRKPVENVSWCDAAAFCNRLSERERIQPYYEIDGEAVSIVGGNGYRLPTEAEWEFACRAGTTTKWSFGNDESMLCEYAWYGGNSGVKPHKVGEKRPNAWGLYDMHGNVWEWCWDWYSNYEEKSTEDPMGRSGEQRVLRGGAFNYRPGVLRSAYRTPGLPGSRAYYDGFRPARNYQGTQPVQPLPATAPASPDKPLAPSRGVVVPGSFTTPPPAIAPFDATKAKQHQDAWAKHLGVPVQETNSIGMRLALIPPGEFEMGSTPEQIAAELERAKKSQPNPQWFLDKISSEGPRHHVRITNPFYLSAYEITQAEYVKVVGSNPSQYKDDMRQPVEKVTWFNAVAFCNRLSERERIPAYYKVVAQFVSVVGGSGYRLPTEAEWEYACRAGTTTKWNFGDDESMLGDYAWHSRNSGDTPHKVGEKKPNVWGLYDMYGNVCEWCWDWEGPYEAKSAKDPMGRPEADMRVMRGGGFFIPGTHRSAFRSGYVPHSGYYHIGFRPARNYQGTPPVQPSPAIPHAVAPPASPDKPVEPSRAVVPSSETTPPPAIAPLRQSKPSSSK